MWEGNIKMIPVLIGILRSIPLKLWDFLEQLGRPHQLGVIQKVDFLNTVHILYSKNLHCVTKKNNNNVSE